jgi:energy-coupling factor transport system ATP-binding protein
LIELKNITVSLPPRRRDAAIILHNIDLTIAGGEWVVLTGPNGCGKTTLLMAIAGLVPAATGTRLVARNDGTPRTIALLFQEPDNQFVASSVRDELRLSLPTDVSREDENATIDEAAEKFSLTGLLQRNPHRLSGGEKQRLAFATVWVSRPEIILLDEPTAYLDDDQRRLCVEFVRTMRESGSAIVWATPREDEVPDATRVVGMADGSISNDRAHDDRADTEKSVKVSSESALGSTAGNRPHDVKVSPAAPPHEGKPLVVELQSVAFGYDGLPVIDGLSARIDEGECVGIAGANGSGKSTLLGLLSGLLEPTTGRIARAYKKPVSNGQQNVFYLFQSPERLFFAETVHEEMAFGLRSLGVPPADISRRVTDALGEVDLASFEQRLPFSLSLGEMRRLAFAMVRVLEPKLLLLDEPTSCLDHDGAAIFDRLIASMRDAGTTLVVASHDRSLLSRLTDRTIEL